MQCSSGAVNVSWQASAGASTYIVQAYMQSQTVPSASCISSSTNCTLTQLQCGTVFNVSVLASDGTCNSSPWVGTTVKTGMKRDKPGARYKDKGEALMKKNLKEEVEVENYLKEVMQRFFKGCTLKFIETYMYTLLTSQILWFLLSVLSQPLALLCCRFSLSVVSAIRSWSHGPR